VVKPSLKRKVVKYLQETHEVGIKKCCDLVGMSRSSWYYESSLDDTEVIEKLKELAKSHPTRGFDNYFYRIRKEGFTWARSRVLRVYRDLGLVRRPKKRKRLPESERKPLYQPSGLNQVWSMDFMHDQLSDGRNIRILNILDDYNRECLLNRGQISFPCTGVIMYLNRLGEEIGLPKYIRTDNGPEFISKEYERWAAENGVTIVRTEPGKPMQNGFIERFNRTFREDILDAFIFRSIQQFNVIAEKWRQDYNHTHPHGSLDGKSPKAYGKRSENLKGVPPLKQEYLNYRLSKES